MLAAVHLENFLFLLFIFVAFLFQLLTRAASKANKKPGQSDTPQSRPTTRPPVPRTRPESDEERIRKFLEALGQPAGSAPPSPVEPRPTYQKPMVLPHVGPFESPLPPLTTKPPPLPRQIIQPPQPAAPRERKAYQPRVAEASTFEVHDPASSVEPVASAKVERSAAVQTDATGARPERDFVALLKSPSGLRNAVILREIFGPPRAFSDLTS